MRKHTKKSSATFLPVIRKPVLPGDQLHYHVRKIRNRGRVWRFFGEAKVDGHVVTEAEVSAMLADTADARAFASKHG